MLPQRWMTILGRQFQLKCHFHEGRSSQNVNDSFLRMSSSPFVGWIGFSSLLLLDYLKRKRKSKSKKWKKERVKSINDCLKERNRIRYYSLFINIIKYRQKNFIICTFIALPTFPLRCRFSSSKILVWNSKKSKLLCSNFFIWWR